MKKFQLKNLRFLEAKTPQEKEAIYKLRHQVYARKLGYLPVNEQERETDEYDLYSSMFFCLLNQQVVGCIRLVVDNYSGFPLERYFSLDSYLRENKIDRRKSLEASRLISLGGYLVRIGLYKCLIEYMDEYSLQHIFLAAVSSKKNHIKNHQRMGFRQIGDSFYYKSCQVFAVPMHLNLTKLREEISLFKDAPSKYPLY